MGIIYWNTDPMLFEWSFLSIRWYGFLFAMAAVSGSVFLTKTFKKEKQPDRYVDRLVLFMLLGTIIGARLGHTLFYDPSYYLSNPIEILKIWKGGLASHGALVGVIVALIIYSKTTANQPFLWVVDRIAVISPLGAALIRLGNFFNSEIIGVPTQSDWGVVFMRVDSLPRHPAQLYEVFVYFVLFLIMLFLFSKKEITKRRGFLFGLFLVYVFSFRILIEFVKVNQAAFESELSFKMGQILSLPAILVGLVFMFLSFRGSKLQG